MSDPLDQVMALEAISERITLIREKLDGIVFQWECDACRGAVLEGAKKNWLKWLAALVGAAAAALANQ